jgi:RNA 2',3'-cyclic 3'-phosphodiesterase
MTSRGSVGGDERLRLFLALRLPDDWLDALARWQEALFAGTPVRVVPRPHLHLTLAFLGSRPAGELAAILEVLDRAAARARPPRLLPERYRETRSVAMLTFTEEGGAGAALAEDVQAGLEAIGAYRREGRPWLPHVTLARFRERPRAQEEIPDTLRTHVLVPSDAAAYLSRLRPSGAAYEVLASVSLGTVED